MMVSWHTKWHMMWPWNISKSSWSWHCVCCVREYCARACVCVCMCLCVHTCVHKHHSHTVFLPLSFRQATFLLVTTFIHIYWNHCSKAYLLLFVSLVCKPLSSTLPQTLTMANIHGSACWSMTLYSLNPAGIDIHYVLLTWPLWLKCCFSNSSSLILTKESALPDTHLASTSP